MQQQSNGMKMVRLKVESLIISRIIVVEDVAEVLVEINFMIGLRVIRYISLKSRLVK